MHTLLFKVLPPVNPTPNSKTMRKICICSIGRETFPEDNFKLVCLQSTARFDMHVNTYEATTKLRTYQTVHTQVTLIITRFHSQGMVGNGDV